MRREVRRILVVAFTALVMSLMAGCGNNETAGIVDMQKVFEESAKAKSLETQLQAKEAEISKRLAKQKETLPADEYVKKERDAQQELMIYATGLQKSFQSQVEQHLAAIAKDKKLGIVMEKQAIDKGGVDITAELIEKLK